jgi:hypothetical protein
MNNKFDNVISSYIKEDANQELIAQTIAQAINPADASIKDFHGIPENMKPKILAALASANFPIANADQDQQKTPSPTPTVQSQNQTAQPASQQAVASQSSPAISDTYKTGTPVG